MNERIRELAKQAGGNPNYKAFRGHFLPPPPDYIDPATVNLEKFAELLVAPIIEAAMKSAEKAVEAAITLEREACADVCVKLAAGGGFAADCAAAIRARGEQ